MARWFPIEDIRNFGPLNHEKWVAREHPNNWLSQGIPDTGIVVSSGNRVHRREIRPVKGPNQLNLGR